MYPGRVPRFQDLGPVKSWEPSGTVKIGTDPEPEPKMDQEPRVPAGIG